MACPVMSKESFPAIAHAGEWIKSVQTASEIVGSEMESPRLLLADQPLHVSAFASVYSLCVALVAIAATCRFQAWC